MGIRVEGLNELVGALDAAPRTLDEGVRKVVEDGAKRVRDDARRRAPKGPHTPHYAESITYDVRTRRGMVEGEIGPDIAKTQGRLENIFEFGAPSLPGGIPHLNPAFDDDTPTFVAEAAKVKDGV